MKNLKQNFRHSINLFLIFRLEAIRIEARAGLKELAQERLARALQECEHSGKTKSACCNK